MENINILDSKQEVDIQDFNRLAKEGVIIDVRPEIEYKMCKLPSTINFPYSRIEKGERLDELEKYLKEKILQGIQNGEWKENFNNYKN